MAVHKPPRDLRKLHKGALVPLLRALIHLALRVLKARPDVVG